MMGDSRKSGRSRKSVDYSKFAVGNSDGDDDDFQDSTPPTKKAKITEQPKNTIANVKGNKARKRDEMLEKQRKAPKDRPSLDERKFEKDLQAALKLSQQSSHNDDVSESEPKQSETTGRMSKIEAKSGTKPDSDFVSDDENEHPPPDPEPKTKAKVEKDDDFEPEVANTPDTDSGESEDDSGASDDSDYEESPPNKSTPGTKPGPKCSKATKSAPVKNSPAKVAPVPRTPSAAVPRTPSAPVPRTPSAAVPRTPSAAVPRTPSAAVPRTPSAPEPRTPSAPVPRTPSAPVPRTPSAPTPISRVSPTVTSKPLTASSGSNRMTAWTPPARIATPSDKSIVTKSPGSGLRLGLSRSQRVKSLHSNAIA